MEKFKVDTGLFVIRQKFFSTLELKVTNKISFDILKGFIPPENLPEFEEKMANSNDDENEKERIITYLFSKINDTDKAKALIEINEKFQEAVETDKK